MVIPNNKNILINKINKDIIQKYKDPNNPDYSFARDSLELKRIYSKVTDRLRDFGFIINDDTDESEMVCKYYYLSKSGTLYSLLLSFVGLYGMVARVRKRSVNILTDSSVENTDEKIIIKILNEYYINILSQDILNEKVMFNPNHVVDYNKPTVYNVLFIEDAPSWNVSD